MCNLLATIWGQVCVYNAVVMKAAGTTGTVCEAPVALQRAAVWASRDVSPALLPHRKDLSVRVVPSQAVRTQNVAKQDEC